MIKPLEKQDDMQSSAGKKRRRRSQAEKPLQSRERERNAAGQGVLFCTAALLMAMSIFCVAKSDAVTASAPKREVPVYFVDRDDNRIAISFDAAWGGDKTEAILDILDEYEVKTTFFLVDIWQERFPELVREIVARGHEIGNHSTTHAEMSKQTREQIVEELKVMSDRAEELTGVRPTLFRPPYGDYDDLVVTTAREEGYEVIQWSVDSLDWKNKGVEDLVNRSTRKVKSGDIILFHNDSQFIVEALPAILHNYREKGLEVVKVSDLLLEGSTITDHQGCQKAAPTNIPEV